MNDCDQNRRRVRGKDGNPLPANGDADPGIHRGLQGGNKIDPTVKPDQTPAGENA